MPVLTQLRGCCNRHLFPASCNPGCFSSCWTWSFAHVQGSSCHKSLCEDSLDKHLGKINFRICQLWWELSSLRKSFPQWRYWEILLVRKAASIDLCCSLCFNPVCGPAYSSTIPDLLCGFTNWIAVAKNYIVLSTLTSMRTHLLNRPRLIWVDLV